MKKFIVVFLALLLPTIAVAADVAGENSFTVSPALGNSSTGDIIFLMKNGDSWSASKTGDLTKDGVEMVSINLATRTVFLNASAPDYQRYARSSGQGNGEKWSCYHGILPQSYRQQHTYAICASNLTKDVTPNITPIGHVVVGAMELLMLSKFNDVAVDQGKVLDAVTSSGAIKIAEQDVASEQLSAYRHAYQNATTSFQLESFIERYKNNDPDGLVPLAEKRLPDLVAQEKADYEHAFETASSESDYEAFINRYSLNDPDTLVPKAQEKINEIRIAMATQVKQIGQSVCKIINVTGGPMIRTSTGLLFYASFARISGYTEKFSGDRVQIRINTIQELDSSGNLMGNVDQVDGPVVYKSDAIIWDDATNWSINCR